MVPGRFPNRRTHRKHPIRESRLKPGAEDGGVCIIFAGPGMMIIWTPEQVDHLLFPYEPVYDPRKKQKSKKKR